MKRRPRKIKRYSRIYHSRREIRRRTVFKYCGFAVILAALIFVGYSVAGPVVDFFSGNIEPSSESSSSSESSLPSSSSSDSSSEESIDGLESMAAITVPHATLQDAAALDAYLKEMKQQGVNTVVLELKNEDGHLLYQSSLEQATQFNAVSADAVDLKAVLRTVDSNDMRCIAQLSAFKDRVAPTADKTMGYLYAGTTGAWWDNSQENGGKPWLNPYRAASVDYLLAIQEELGNLGVDYVMWTKVSYPEVATLSSVDFNSDIGEATQQEALDQFVQKATAQGAADGQVVMISYPVSAAFGVNESWYGGNPTGLKNVKYAAPVLNLTSFNASVPVGGEPVDLSDTTAATTAILTEYKKLVKSGVTVLPVIPAGVDASAVVTALGPLNIDQYVNNATS